jgi:hypothetical protein
MDEVEDQCGTDPAPSADNPLEMHQEEATRTIGWVLELRRHMLSHYRSLELATDKQAAERNVAIAYFGELLKFAGRDRVLRPMLRPLAELAYALGNGTRGSLAAYSKPTAVGAGAAPTVGRPSLDSTQHLRGVVAHLVETLAAGKAFRLGEAAAEVTKALNTAGCRMPNGKKFKPNTVTDWHELVVHSAHRTDLEHDVHEGLKLDLNQRHPEHMGWDRSRLLAWLTETARLLARTGLG